MKWPILLLGIFFLNMVAAGEYVLWPAAWLLPVLLVWVFRHYPRWYYFWIVVVVLGISNVITLQGMTPLPVPVEAMFHLFVTLVALVPYWLDRRYHRRRQGFSSSLVLPVAMVLLEYVNTLTSPWGSWGATAYTQADNLVLAQFAALFGIYGIGFLIYWTAALVNNWYEQASLRRMRNSLAAYLAVILFVVIYGSMQLSATQASDSIRVAAIVKSNFELIGRVYKDHTGDELDITRTVSQASPEIMKAGPAMQDFFAHPSAERYAKTRDLLHDIENEAFILAEQAIENGASVIAWFEGQFYGFGPQEDALIQRGREFAARHNVTLFMPMAIIDPEKIESQSPYFMKNQIVIIDRGGQIVHTYHKAKPVPGAEPVKPGDGLIPVIEVDDARLSAVICYDADFPQFMTQSGRKGTQILFIPSGDWFNIKRTHLDMARMRAIENGVNVVRPANNGISSVIDSHGRLLKQINYFEHPNHTLMADVPVATRETFYSRNSEVFIYAMLVLALILFVDYLIALFRREVPNL
ncbi:MAG: hypothetical protein HUJ29_03520 [Gammaproteobacteria bacterium]|nr:hypothetical protein [Gammaproteobacteria bacterium]